MTAIAPAAVAPPGWLRGRDFDLSFVVGIPVLALACGVLVAQDPRFFAPLLLLDLWLLGYPHVVATGTRLCFDRESLRRSCFLLFGLPPLVLLGVVALATGIGAWTLGTTSITAGSCSTSGTTRSTCSSSGSTTTGASGEGSIRRPASCRR